MFVKRFKKKKNQSQGRGHLIKKLYHSYGGLRYLSTILLKDFHLFKIAESVISFCFNFFLS